MTSSSSIARTNAEAGGIRNALSHVRLLARLLRPGRGEARRLRQQSKKQHNRKQKRPRNGSPKPNEDHDVVTRLNARNPCLAQAIHLQIFAMLGGALGLGIAILIRVTADHLEYRLWVYAIGILIALVLKVVGQYIWLKWLRRVASIFGRRALQMRGIPHDPQAQVPIELSEHLSLTVPVGVITAIATILSTEKVTPGWMSEFGWYLGIVALAGFIATALDALASPRGLYILLYNRLPSEENRDS